MPAEMADADDGHARITAAMPRSRDARVLDVRAIVLVV